MADEPTGPVPGLEVIFVTAAGGLTDDPAAAAAAEVVQRDGSGAVTRRTYLTRDGAGTCGDGADGPHGG